MCATDHLRTHAVVRTWPRLAGRACDDIVENLHGSDRGQLGNQTFRQERRPEGRRIKPSAGRSYHPVDDEAAGRRSNVWRQGRDSVARSEHDRLQ